MPFLLRPPPRFRFRLKGSIGPRLLIMGGNVSSVLAGTSVSGRGIVTSSPTSKNLSTLIGSVSPGGAAFHPSPILFGGVPGGGGGSSCFAAGTMIAIPDGECPIEALEENDRLFAYDFASGSPVESKLLRIDRHEARAVIRVLTAAGELLGTPEHLVWTGNEWQPLGMTAALMLADGTLAPVLSRDPFGEVANVYNLHVEHEDHAYLANGFVVHNIKADF